MPDIKGGCLCGAVRYSAAGEPKFVGVCHCRDCQKFTGAAFAIVLGVPTSELQVSGPLGTYASSADSGKSIRRKFCSKCGSSLIDEADAMPGVGMIAAGTLDDASWVKPSMEIFCDSAQPWVHLGGEMKRFPKMPG